MTNVTFIPHQRAQNSGARRCQDRPAGKPPIQWRHVAGQQLAFPVALTPGLHSKEGVTQEGPLSMITYGVCILPLINNLKREILDVTQPFIITLTNPSDSAQLFLPPSDDTDTLHVMSKDVRFQGSAKIGCCCRKHGKNNATKRQGSIAPRALIKTRTFIIFMCFTG